MRKLSDAQLLGAWERGLPQLPVQQALTLLNASCPEIPIETLANLNIGLRDAFLLTMREETFGPQMAEMHLRQASSDDIPIMANHHRNMFEEILERKGERLDPARAQELEKSYAQKLEREMVSGTYRAWIIEDGGNIVSSGGVTFINLVPNPSDVSSSRPPGE